MTVLIYLQSIHLRQKSGSQSSDEEPAVASKAKPDAVKKSIYSDDEDESQPQFNPPKKNFPGELKPGLNRVGLNHIRKQDHAS